MNYRTRPHVCSACYCTHVTGSVPLVPAASCGDADPSDHVTFSGRESSGQFLHAA